MSSLARFFRLLWSRATAFLRPLPERLEGGFLAQALRESGYVPSADWATPRPLVVRRGGKSFQVIDGRND